MILPILVVLAFIVGVVVTGLTLEVVRLRRLGSKRAAIAGETGDSNASEPAMLGYGIPAEGLLSMPYAITCAECGQDATNSDLRTNDEGQIEHEVCLRCRAPSRWLAGACCTTTA